MKTAVEQELERIKDTVNRLFGSPENILIAIIRSIEPSYFWDKSNEKVVLTENDKERATKLYRFVAASELSDFTKTNVCGAVLAFLRTVSTEDDINVLKSQAGYDPAFASTSIFVDLD